jgi:twitching motility protein PilJ
MSLDVRTAAQAAASTATATEMQMLSQRLSSSSTLALQGRPVAFEAVRDTRERFKVDLDALQRGGTIKGVTLDAADDDATHLLLTSIKTRWDRMDGSVEQLLESQQRLIDVAKGSATVAQGSKQLVEMSQRAVQQGASQREAEYANQLALLSQRIAKNAAALVSSTESDPELAALLTRDAGAFREVVRGDLVTPCRRDHRVVQNRGGDRRSLLVHLLIGQRSHIPSPLPCGAPSVARASCAVASEKHLVPYA